MDCAHECMPNCNGLWYEKALQVLRNNEVHPYVFSEAFHSRQRSKKKEI